MHAETAALAHIDAHARMKLAAARARLVLERPFLGALTLYFDFASMPATVDRVLGTDGQAVYYDADAVASMSQRELQFWLAHEALHCALGHLTRRLHRVRRRWEVACDHAVNSLLIADGFAPPDGALANDAFAGLAAEEIYPLIPDDTEETAFDQHGFEHDTGHGGLAGYLGEQRMRVHANQTVASPTRGDQGATDVQADPDAWDDAGFERRRHHASGQQLGNVDGRGIALEQDWKSRLAAAAQAAREAGRLGDSWLRRLERLIEPALPWRALLARYVYSVAQEDYSFQRPPRRERDALLPRLSHGALRIVAALDSSGSITQRELSEFASELDALKAQVRAELIVHACDERLAMDGPWSFNAWEPIQLPDHLAGGGGTRFTPIFDWIAETHQSPELLIYFTDAQGEFPESPPPYPVLWLVKGPERVPFGDRIQLNA